MVLAVSHPSVPLPKAYVLIVTTYAIGKSVCYIYLLTQLIRIYGLLLKQ